MRLDKGAVLENFFIAEKIKQHSYSMSETNAYFWRNAQGGEIDFIESDNQGSNSELNATIIYAYEIKWKNIISAPGAFTTTYPNAHFQCVNLDNIVETLNQPQ